MIHKNVKTIDQQSYYNPSTMKNQLNTRMKHDNGTNNEKSIETQQWHTAMKSSNRTTMKTTMKHKNEKTPIIQQIVQQWKTN